MRDAGVKVVALAEANVIISHPPSDRKWDYLKQYRATGLPFFILLQLKDATTKEWRKLFTGVPFDLIILNGNCLFIDGDRIRDGGPCGWFLFFPNATGKMSMVNIGDFGDVVLGDEDSVDGRGYDTDEKECEDLDKAILNDPSSTFTKEGYLVDGVTVGDEDESL